MSQRRPPSRPGSDDSPNGAAERRRHVRRDGDETLQWFRTLAETTATAIFVYRDRFLYVNPACSEVTGYDRDELLGLEFWRLVHPDHREMIRERGERRLRGEPVPKRYAFKVLHKDGAARWLDFTSGLIQFEGAPAALGTAFDITEQRAAAERLEASEERLRLAQRAADIVTWEWDPRTDSLHLSEYAEELYGAAAETLGRTGAAFLEIVAREDRPRFEAALREALHGGDTLTAEIRIHTPLGLRWLFERAQVFRNGDGRAIRLVGAAVDVTARKQAELALRDSAETHRLLVEAQTELVARLDPGGVLDYVSPSFCRFFDHAEADLVGRMPPFLEPSETTELLARLAPPPHTVSRELRAVHRGSTPRWLAWNFRGVLDDDGALRHVVAVGRDVTERRIAEEALFEEKERAQIALESIGDAVLRTDAGGRIDYLNPAAERLGGWRLSEIYGRPFAEIVRLLEARGDQPLADPLAACLAEGRRVELPGEAHLLDRHGGRRLVRTAASPLRDRTGHLRGAVVVFQDLTSLRRVEAEVRHLERHDSLTGLLNRRAFEEILEAAAAEAHHGGGGTLLYLDLQTFKLVNDSCGHIAGDALLRRAAGVLRELGSHGEVVARLGADEFAVLVSGPTEAARALADQIRVRFASLRFTWEDRVFTVAAAIGLVALAGIDGEDLPGLLAAADAACELAKTEGRGRVHEYRSGDNLLARHGEVQWVQRIHRAFDADGFTLYCQEIQPLAGAGQQPALCEVLIRMRGEDGTVIPAAAFIPAAERYHLIDLVDRWVVRRTLEAIGANGHGSLFALNLSGQSLGDESFLAYVLEELDRATVDPRRLCFEITETAAVENMLAARRCISVLKARGCRFVLDDFGSGMSSFAYLQNLPVDYLKIDGSFVRDMNRDAMRRVLVESIHSIGRALGIRTIAESVETPEVLRELERIGVDFAQGYWIGRPRPLGE